MSSQWPDFWTAIHPDLSILAKRGYDDVDAPVAIQVAESAAPMARRREQHSKPASSVKRRPFPARAEIAKYGVVLVHGLSGHR